jgi:L-ascorbate metabolism protein UlaG (beta-lactamase superfamily)
MLPGCVAEPFEGLSVKAVPAYNISEGHTDFHPKEREDCGYILTLGGTTIYVAGDTEDNDDVLALQGVDIAFLPVNQPYTMTVEQAERVVKAIKPAIFYPYHYGQVEQKTDIDALAKSLEGVRDVRVFPME